jgi:hypothetical protein
MSTPTCEPDKILEQAARTLDFSQPVAIMLLGTVHHITDDDEAHAVVQRLVDAVPSGSYLVITQTTNQVTGAAMDEAVRPWNETARPRSSSAPHSSSLTSLRAWRCWSPASCRPPGGGRILLTPAATVTWTSTARSGSLSRGDGMVFLDRGPPRRFRR